MKNNSSKTESKKQSYYKSQKRELILKLKYKDRYEEEALLLIRISYASS